MTSEYINAGDARKLTEASQSLYSAYMREEMEKIMRTITNCANKGLNSASWVRTDPIIMRQLKELGFDVTLTRDQRDGNYMAVSW